MDEEKNYAEYSREELIAIAREHHKSQESNKKNQERILAVTKAGVKAWTGPDLYNSILKLITEVQAMSVSKTTIATVAAHLVIRLTRYGVIALLIALFPTFLLIIQTWILNRQSNLLIQQNYRLEQQTKLQEAERRSAMAFLLNATMDAVDMELKDPEKVTNKYYKTPGSNKLFELGEHDYSSTTLSKSVMARLGALSNRMEPYQHLDYDRDSINEELFSPEREMLFRYLINCALNDLTFKYLWTICDFTNMDVTGLNAYGLNLTGLNLSDGAFMDLEIEGYELNQTHLSGVSLYNAEFISGRFEPTLDDTEMFFVQISNSDLRFRSNTVLNVYSGF